jgi:hypothetical protein
MQFSQRWLKRTLIAAILAGILSGIPSTTWAIVTGGDIWEATLAAGAALIGSDATFAQLLAAATVAHGGMSLFWAGVLCAILPKKWPVIGGTVAGVAIAVLDILVIGQALPSIRELAFLPQLADHMMFGAVVGAVVGWVGLERTSKSINTRKVSGRRKLRFETMADLEEDIERLATADVECLGNWSLGQIFTHLARVMLTAVDGAGFRPPLISRLFVFFFKPVVRRWLLEKGMPAGLSHKGIKGLGEVPKAKAMVADSSVTTEEGLAELRTAIERYKSADKLHPHLAFGNISREDWDRFHFRHAELHLSFVVPK